MNQLAVEYERLKEEQRKHGQIECCPEIPELRRLQYFYGQMLSGADLREEQQYFREKLKLLNRCVHGSGVICGLKVISEPGETPCDPEIDKTRTAIDQDLDRLERQAEEIRSRLMQIKDEYERRSLEDELKAVEAEAEALHRRLDELCPPGASGSPPARVRLECGIAIDCAGNEIIVRRSRVINLYDYLEPADLRSLRDNRRQSMWVSICFCESQVEPVRPVYSDPCKPADGCRYAKVQESYRIRVRLQPPEADRRCEPCCCGCGDACLVLARVDYFKPGHPLPDSVIDNGVRRRFGLYDWATITGISWVHGGHYTADQASWLLRHHGDRRGLEFRFSRGVLAETLDEGVIDVWVVEGGRGRAGGIYSIKGKTSNPAARLVDRVFFQQESDDKLHEGDRVLIRLRGDFVLDECCRPLDANHIGGRVPLIQYPGYFDHPKPTDRFCRESPDHPGVWRSGDGHGGGLFESWIWIREPHHGY